MRIKSKDTFASRPSKAYKENPKYFLIFEGEVTEPQYFEGINEHRNKLAIPQKLSIINVLRNLEDLSKSHPIYALKMAKEIISSTDAEFITKENLLKNIKDYIIVHNKNSSGDLITKANEYINNYVEDNIYFKDVDNIICDIFKEDVFNNIASNIINYINFQRYSLDYNPDIDVINLIVDRDKGSFKAEQYDKLLKECEDKQIKLYVSNPCFEVWLLMHFDEFEKLDFQKLLENKRVSSKKKSRKYTDKKLSEIIGYDKANLNFNDFIDKVDDAIVREKNYCEDLKGLKENVGSNVGILISDMRN